MKKLFPFLIAVLVFSGAASAQKARQMTGNTLPGVWSWFVQDTVQIKGTGKDTSGSYLIAGSDKLSFWMRVDNRADSVNVTAYLDIGPGDGYFVEWAPIDTIVVSGTQDTSAYVNIASPPNWAYQARVRLVGAAAATDSAKIDARLTKTISAADAF